MKYDVTLRDRQGGTEIVTVEAEGGDDAAAKAFKPYHMITSVQPAAKKAKA